MEDKLKRIDDNAIITYLTVDDKTFAAFTINDELNDNDNVYFAECGKIDDVNVLLPIVSNDILNKVLKKYDEYVDLMSSDIDIEDEEEY